MVTYITLIKFPTRRYKGGKQAAKPKAAAPKPPPTAQAKAKDAANMKAAKDVRAQYMEACPGIELTDHHYFLTGPYDFMHVFKAPNPELAFKMTGVLLSSGSAEAVETWPAIDYGQALDWLAEI